MPDGLILAVDQGTTNTKALLVAADGSIVAQASCPLTQQYPRPAWVEQDPLDLWQSVSTAIDRCLAAGGDPDLAAVAVTNQRETSTIWHRQTGQPLGPAVGWQCHRTADFCRELRERGLEPTLRERTGLTVDPMFAGTKLRWLLQHAPGDVPVGEICLGTVDSWVLWNLTGGAVHACDLTNASRTQLLNLCTLAWDPELLAILAIPVESLPEPRPSSALFGETVAVGRLPAGVPVAALIGDSHGALFGHGKYAAGTVKATYGTGSSLMSPTPEPIISARGVSTTIAWGLAGDGGRPEVVYALEGNIYATGAAVQWLGEVLGLADPGPDVQALASQVEMSDGVYLVPAFTGLGAPHWDDAARALLCGMTRGTTPAHLARAALESIAFQVRDVFDVMHQDLHEPLGLLLADGGASRNDLLMQFQADILGCPVVRSASAELSAIGAAYLAGLAVGVWPDVQAIEALPRPADRFEPRMDPSTRRALWDGWQQALARAMVRS